MRAEHELGTVYHSAKPCLLPCVGARPLSNVL